MKADLSLFLVRCGVYGSTDEGKFMKIGGFEVKSLSILMR